MIETLKDTTSGQIASRLNELRREHGANGFGRVLTLIVVVPDMIDVEGAISISDAVSREHPCRVIVVVESDEACAGADRLNAQLRVGADAGASELIVLEPRGGARQALDSLVMPLLLSDTPVVVYWPSNAPKAPSKHPLGAIAVRRITDARNAEQPLEQLRLRGENYAPGDSDVAWAGITIWRGLLAAVLSEECGQQVASIEVRGSSRQPASHLLAAWLHLRLGVAVQHVEDPQSNKISGVFINYADGSQVSLTRGNTSRIAHLHRPGLPTMFVPIESRSTPNCLREELRRLNPDKLYGQVIREGIKIFSGQESLADA